MSNKDKKEKVDEFGGLLTKEQQKELQGMINGMFETAAGVAKEYEDLDISELQELSGSITQINHDSPFLNEIFKGDSWKKVIKNIPKKSKDGDAS